MMGELVETRWHPKTVDAVTLAAWRAERRDHILFDTRPPAEFRKMTLPGARSLPNGELLHRFTAAVPDGDTPIVLTCAGRTRGLVGAIGLRAAGICNPVYALENGTQGWALAGLALDRGAVPEPLPGMRRATAEESRRRGEALATRAGVPFIDAVRFRSSRAIARVPSISSMSAATRSMRPGIFRARCMPPASRSCRPPISGLVCDARAWFSPTTRG